MPHNLNHIKSLFPNGENPKKYSTTYKYNIIDNSYISDIYEDLYDISREYINIKLPYKPNTIWTSFKVLYNKDILGDDCIYSIRVITDDNYTYIINKPSILNTNEWYDLRWSIPAVDFNNCGVYITISAKKGLLSAFNIQHIYDIELLGYICLQHNHGYYVLIDSATNVSEFIISCHNWNGIIFHIENTDYLNNILYSTPYYKCYLSDTK